MSKYQECKQIFEDAIDFLENNKYNTERFHKLVHELIKYSDKEYIVNILLCVFLHKICDQYKLDRSYAGPKLNARRKEINSHPERYGPTRDELAHIINSFMSGYKHYNTEDYKRIAKEMSELVHERGWENKPY